MADNVVEEYVVKLGTMIDNEGVNRILSFFDSSKMKALGLGAAVAGATAAVYKFIEAATANEFELAKLAKQKKKSVELTRAENNAMKAMGKTMAEINKDQNLKKIYKDLVEFNKEMAMPNTSKALDNIRNLEVAFAKLKSVVNTAVQYINAQMLINLERPIERITGKVGSIADWLKENMKQYAPKIATVLTDFALGIMGIVEAGGKLLKWFNELDPAIKSVGETILWLLAIVKGGSIGRVLMLINAVGAVIQDYNNFKWNQEHPGEDPIPTLNDAFGVWDLIDSDDPEKWSKFSTKVVEYFTEWMNSAFQDFDMSKIFGDGTESGGGLFASITKWFKDNDETTKKFGKSFIEWLARGVRTVGGTAGGVSATLIDALFGSGTASDTIFTDKDGSASATFAGGIGGFIFGFGEKLKEKDGNVWKALKAGMKDMTIGSLLTSILANMAVDGEGNVTIDWESIGVDLTAVGESLVGIITASIDTLTDVGGTILNAIGGAISKAELGSESIGKFTTTIGGVITKWSENKTLTGGLTTAITAAFSGASFIESLGAGLVGAFTEAQKNAMEKAVRKGGIDPTGMTRDQLEKAFGGLDESLKADYWKDIFGDLGNAGGEMIKGLWDALMATAVGAGDIGGELLASLMETIAGMINVSFDGDSVKNNEIFGGIATAIGIKMAGGSFLTSLLGGITTAIAGAAEKIDKNNPEMDTLWKVVKKEAEGFWAALEDLWLGASDENGNRDESKGLKKFFEEMIGDLFGEGGAGSSFLESIMAWLKPIGEAIKEFFVGIFTDIGSALGPILQKAWIDFYNSSGEGSVIDNLFNDPNSSKATRGKDGKFYVESTSGGMNRATPELLSRIGGILPYIRFDENGMMKFTGDAEGWGDSGASSSLANAWNQARNGDYRALENVVNDARKKGFYSEGSNVRTDSILKGVGENLYYNGGHYYALSDDGKTGHRWNSKTNEWDAMDSRGLKGLQESANTLKVNGIDPLLMGFEDTGDKTKKLSTALADSAGQITETVSALVSELGLKIEQIASFSVGGDGKKAWGGRIGSPGRFLVGEDGAEYIIPVTKPKRAMELINSALSEMGMSAMSKFSGDLGIGGGGGALGGALEALVGSMNGGSTTVSAPVNIYVTATGADGRDIGVWIYDTAERQLIRTLTGVV